MQKRALLVVNRQARQGSSALDNVIDRLRSFGLELVEEPCRKDLVWAELFQRHKNNVDLVIIGGGDGTLNAAADALTAAQLPLGILPLGTANDLARTLGIPTDLSAACQVIADGNTKLVDLGWVNGKHFFNVASMGLSVEIAKQITKESKGKWGVLAYLVTALRVIWNVRPHHFEIRGSGETLRVKSVQVAVGNGRYYGGGLTVAEDAAIDDGVLNLYSIEVKHWWEILLMLPSIRQGSLSKWPGVRALNGQEFEIISRRPRSVNTDGELTTHTPAHFRVVPRALSIFVPKSAD